MHIQKIKYIVDDWTKSQSTHHLNLWTWHPLYSYEIIPNSKLIINFINIISFAISCILIHQTNPSSS